MSDLDALRASMAAHGIPASLRGGLVRYLADRIRPGSYLLAVLSGDLIAAMRASDPVSLDALGRLTRWLWEHAPVESWGTPEAVAAWLTGGGR